MNFAVFSQHATGVTLVLFKEDGSEWEEYALDPAIHRTGDVWHAEISNCPLVSLQCCRLHSRCG